MTSPPLDNLVKIGQLKVEPKNESGVHRLLAMARTRLGDASDLIADAEKLLA